MLNADCQTFAHLLQANQRNLREEKRLQSNLALLDRERRIALQACQHREQLARDQLMLARQSRRGLRRFLKPLEPPGYLEEDSRRVQRKEMLIPDSERIVEETVTADRILSASLTTGIPYRSGLITTGGKVTDNPIIPELVLPETKAANELEGDDCDEEEDADDWWNPSLILNKMVTDEKEVRNKFRRNVLVCSSVLIYDKYK